MSHKKMATLTHVGSETPKEVAVPILLARMLLNVKLSPSGCWEWQGWKNRLGYGNATLAGKPYMVHRFMYEALTNEPIPKGFEICHSCHNPGCINPYHIRSGTHQENLLESSAAKRLNGQQKTKCKRGHALEGDNLWISSSGFRQCRLCSRARYRRRLGWPEHLLYAEIVVPKGYALDRKTGQVISARDAGLSHSSSG